ncbi:unnamed protein product [Camellia sinensis]
MPKKSIVSLGRGILAIDESNATCGKRLSSIGLDNTKVNRQAYRQLLLTTPSLGEYISGVILFEKTLYQSTTDGKKFVNCLREQNIVLGIKVNKGLVPLPGSNNESWCQGLNGLASRSAEYYKQDACFAKCCQHSLWIMMEYQGNAYFSNLMNEFDVDHDFTTESPQQESQSLSFSPEIITQTTKISQRKGNFTEEEDMMLISSWLNISLDPIRGNEQKSKAYWLRVWENYNKYKTFDSERTQTSLMNRWSTIQLATNKFCGCFAQVERLNRSGSTEKDKIQDAKKLYKDLYHSNFPFEHCWNELRSQPKWMEDTTTKKQKSTKNASPATSTPCTPDSVNLENNDNHDVVERPIGRKAAKKNKAKDLGNNVTESPFVKLLEEIKVKNDITNEKKIEIFEKSYLQEERRIENEEKREERRLALEERREEERIMSMDTSIMPPLQAQYIRQRQMQILEKGN